MRLKDLARIKTDMRDADFWIKRRGSIQTVGEPVLDYSKEHIGIKVERTDMLDPRYLFYLFQHLWMSGQWRTFVQGTTTLVSIRTQDVANLPLRFTR